MKCRVWLRSKPGPYAQYNGHVDVDVEIDEDNLKTAAFYAAVQKLRRTSFPDRSAALWKSDRVEVLS